MMFVKNKRNLAIDYLKVLAVFFVVILHVNGYTKELFGLDGYTNIAKTEYLLLEAIAYPSIHIFVLIGSFFLSNSSNIKQQIIRIYSQTWIVTFVGLIIAVFIIPTDISWRGGIICLFPFSQRAYWFVSDYIILILLSPFLSIVAGQEDKRIVYRLTGVLFLLISILPYVSVSSWYKGNLLLFILLYCISQIIMHKITFVQRHRLIWGLGWISCIAILLFSAIGIQQISDIMPFFKGKEMILYQYSCPIVVAESVCIVCFFLSGREDQQAKERSIGVKWICNASLLVYLIHMHPIFKTVYTKYSLLQYVNVNSPIYFFYILLTVGDKVRIMV